MKRFIFEHLIEWKKEQNHKPLIIRGARQVGKSYIIKEFGKTFDNLVELNFELMPELKKIFDNSLEPTNLILKLSIALGDNIIPGKTLLFFDEIQACPLALTSLRYFYEKLPELHVIAAGSLIDFVLEEVGIPVGRIRSLYMYPMSFSEFLIVTGNEQLFSLIKRHNYNEKLDDIFHNKLISILGEYITVGGMPAAIKEWISSRNLKKVQYIHNDLIDTYKQDFFKYSKMNKIKHLEKVFNAIPRMLGKKFVFSTIDGDLRSRELKPALFLLEKAGVAHIITHTSSNGLPLGAENNVSLFKVIFLDIALTQTLLGIKPGSWILKPEEMIINKGEIAEAFVGQEILANSDPYLKVRLYYWLREKKGSNAELDYVVSKKERIIPIEVKSGKSGSLKSLKKFLEEKPHVEFGLHFSQRNFSINNNILSYPIYSVCKLEDE